MTYDAKAGAPPSAGDLTGPDAIGAGGARCTPTAGSELRMTTRDTERHRGATAPRHRPPRAGRRTSSSRATGRPTPYPHIVLDDFLEPGAAEAAIAEFPPLDPEQWNNYLHANERKFTNTDPDHLGSDAAADPGRAQLPPLRRVRRRS